MLNIIKGIMYRIIKNKAYLLMALVVTPIVIISAVYFNNSSFVKPTIAVIGEDNINWDMNEVNIKKIENSVPKSDLVKNKYDAVVYFRDGQVTIDSIKSNEFVDKIKDIIQGKSVNFTNKDNRGEFGNIAAFIVMFMLFLGIMLYKCFFDERNGIYKRIISSNISYVQYIASHLISVFIMIELPVLLITLLVKLIFNINTAISISEIVMIITTLSMLAASFGMFISSIVRSSQSASMLGAMINVITTIMSGCFFSITNKGIVGGISNLLPQKNILDITIALENSKAPSNISILNVAILIILLTISTFFINILKMRGNKYV